MDKHVDPAWNFEEAIHELSARHRPGSLTAGKTRNILLEHWCDLNRGRAFEQVEKFIRVHGSLAAASRAMQCTPSTLKALRTRCFEATQKPKLSRTQGLELAFRFLSERAKTGATFTIEEIAKNSSWKPSTPKTYIAKLWAAYIAKVGRNYTVSADFARYTLEDFLLLSTQKRPVPPGNGNAAVSIPDFDKSRLHEQFESLGSLGRGGFAQVHKVRLPDGTICAKKTFAPLARNVNKTTIENLKTRFKREIDAHRMLPEGITLPILDHSIDGDELWFTMPLADLTLEEFLVDATDLLGVLAAFIEILNVLERLHDADRVHRDLAPSNVFRLNGRWILADLGLISAGSVEEKFTSPLSAWGHQRYAAPESYQQFAKVNHKADIFSFGRIMTEAVVRLYSDYDLVPVTLQQALSKCTQEQPRDRYGTTRELITTLQASLDELKNNDGNVAVKVTE